MFVVDGETDVNQARDTLYGGAVQGYYTNNRIVIITDDTDEIRVNRDTLVHELVHALQDQRFGLERTGETLDAQRAETGLIEGEANYLPHLYAERCDDDWQCLPEIGAPADAELEADDEVDPDESGDDATPVLTRVTSRASRSTSACSSRFTRPTPRGQRSSRRFTTVSPTGAASTAPTTTDRRVPHR